MLPEASDSASLSSMGLSSIRSFNSSRKRSSSSRNKCQLNEKYRFICYIPSSSSSELSTAFAFFALFLSGPSNSSSLKKETKFCGIRKFKKT